MTTDDQLKVRIGHRIGIGDSMHIVLHHIGSLLSASIADMLDSGHAGQVIRLILAKKPLEA